MAAAVRSASGKPAHGWVRLHSPLPSCTSHPLQAALGGSPSRLGLVQAFLRVKEKDRGALDFDQVRCLPMATWRPACMATAVLRMLNQECTEHRWQEVACGGLPTWPAATQRLSSPSPRLQPGGVDTTWQRIYCCLRAGFHAEAVQVRTP